MPALYSRIVGEMRYSAVHYSGHHAARKTFTGRRIYAYCHADKNRCVKGHYERVTNATRKKLKLGLFCVNTPERIRGVVTPVRRGTPGQYGHDAGIVDQADATAKPLAELDLNFGDRDLPNERRYLPVSICPLCSASLRGKGSREGDDQRGYLIARIVHTLPFRVEQDAPGRGTEWRCWHRVPQRLLPSR